jgi:hypothetical protein
MRRQIPAGLVLTARQDAAYDTGMTYHRELHVSTGAGRSHVAAVRRDDRQGRAELDAIAFELAGPGVQVSSIRVDRIANDKGKGRYR